MRTSKIPLLAASVVALVGLLLIFGPLLHLLTLNPVHTHLQVFHRSFNAANVVSLPIIGIMLIYTSIFVYHRRTLAVVLSSTICLLTVAYLVVLYPQGRITLPVMALITVYAALIAINYKQFSVSNRLEGIVPYLRRIGIIAAVGFGYGVVGFLLLGPLLFHTRFSVLTAVDLTLDSLTGFSGTIAEPTRVGQLFIDSLGGIGIVIFIVLLGALFRPLRFRILSDQHSAHEKAAAIIKASSRSSEDFFKLWPDDKMYFFSADERSFIAYKQSGRTIVVLGDPTGKRSEFSRLLEDFLKYCHSLGWYVAVINATPKGQKLYEKNGLAALFIGNEGVVDVRLFEDQTRKNKHFRYVANKAKRERLTVEEWDTLTPDRLANLRAISRNWLHRDGRREYTFFMGYFDRKYLEQCRIFVLCKDGRPVGYVNLIPTYFKGHASLDHLRNRSDTPSVGMHYLLMNVIATLQKEGNISLNIGLAPLSGIDMSEVSALPRAIFRVLRLFGSSYYSFQGLEQFKNKFKPTWEPRSLIYSGTSASLIRIARDVEHASAFGNRGNRYVVFSTLAGIVVLTIGLYLMLV